MFTTPREREVEFKGWLHIVWKPVWKQMQKAYGGYGYVFLMSINLNTVLNWILNSYITF